MNAYPGAVIIVSHDRYLLDLVADEIVEATFDGKTRKIQFLNPDLGHRVMRALWRALGFMKIE